MRTACPRGTYTSTAPDFHICLRATLQQRSINQRIKKAQRDLRPAGDARRRHHLGAALGLDDHVPAAAGQVPRLQLRCDDGGLHDAGGAVQRRPRGPPSKLVQRKNVFELGNKSNERAHKLLITSALIALRVGLGWHGMETLTAPYVHMPALRNHGIKTHFEKNVFAWTG